MSGYMIFALVLTIGYIIYYGVVLWKDLYGKPANASGHNAEEFKVDFTDPEEEVEDAATVVVESDNGFCVGDNVYEEPTASVKVSEDTSSPQDDKAQAKVEELKDAMEVSHMHGEAEMDSDQMEELLKNADKAKMFKPTVDIVRKAV